MMKILNSCGTLLQVTEVQPLCEEVVSFNGHDIVMTARAKDLSVRPTAMALAHDRPMRIHGTGRRTQGISPGMMRVS